MSCRTTISASLLSVTAIGLALVSGCAVSPADEATGEGNAALDGSECSADDPDCTGSEQPPICDPDDTACASECDPDDATCQPTCSADDPDCASECDPDDTACQPTCSADDPSCDPAPIDCAPMNVATAGDCDHFWGYAWNGASCVGLSGCECEGGCDELFQELSACSAAFESCTDPPVWDCASLASNLATLLRAAQSCNPAAAGPFVCRAFVPSAFGCAEPVSSADSLETKAYLEAFEVYAQHCPLPVPPCPDPTTLPTACVQSSDVDSLVGLCVLTDDGTASDDPDA